MPPKNQKKVDKDRQAELKAKRAERNAARPSAGVLKADDDDDEPAPRVMSRKQARQEAKKAKARAAAGADPEAAAAAERRRRRRAADSDEDEAFHSDSEQYAPRRTVEEQTGAAKLAAPNSAIIVSAGGGARAGKQKWPSYVFLKGTGYAASGKASKNNLRDITIEDFSLAVPGKTLLKKATLTLAYGHKYGILGRNGIGKSVLLRAISERDPATPFGAIPPSIRILHVQQEVAGDDRSCLDTVLAADIERTWLMAEADRLTKLEEEKKKKDADAAAAAAAAAAAGEDGGDDDDEDYDEEDEEDGDDDDGDYTLVDIYERMREIEAQKAVPRAMQILVGLGFQEDEIKTKPTRAYSGGWRMRIALAQALFLQPELLILDEPTNHLDLQAVIWLEAYLMRWKKTLLLVTHDASFLSNTCDHIIHYHNYTLTQYKGDYWQFLKARDVHLAGLKRKLDKQGKTAAKMKELAQRQKSGKNVAGAKAKLKKFEAEEKVEMEAEEPVPEISFPEPGALGLPVLQFQDVTFGYDPARPLFRHLEFGVYMDSRIGLVGPNGAGKTTLIKLMSGDLKENSGYVARNTHLVMARFAQHHVDQLNMDMTPIEYMQSKFGDAQTQDLRQFLGRFGVRGGMALQRIGTLSGGQRSRLVFAEICWRSPHILLLDEPTNHLDMDTIEALIDGIREFKGGVVLISHHQRLIEAACNEVWVVRDGEIERFDGDFEEYKRSVLRSMPPVDDE